MSPRDIDTSTEHDDPVQFSYALLLLDPSSNYKFVIMVPFPTFRKRNLTSSDSCPLHNYNSVLMSAID